MSDDRTRTQDGSGAPRLIAGQYELWRRIDDGRGGMGIVYEAFDHKLQQRVALKCPKRGMWDVLRARQRLIDEARLQAQLKRHPHIVFVQNFHDEGLGRPMWLVMEFIEGWTLDALIDKKGRLPIATAAAIAFQVADALEYAHERDIIHRDIKPSNIMSDRNGWAWVMDFGIARLVKQTIFSKTGQETSGTPLYMAPEQYTGGKAARDKRVDIFAFGAVLYEMLAGEPAFGDAADPKAAKESEVRIPLVEHRDDVPPGLLQLIDACLRARQEERPPDFGAVKTALREAAPDLLLPRSPAPGSEPQRPKIAVAPESIRVEAGTVAGDADLVLVRLRGSGLGEEFLTGRRAESITDALISEFLVVAAGRGFTRLSYEQIKGYLDDSLAGCRERWEKAAWEALAEAGRALEAGDVGRRREIVAKTAVPAQPRHLHDAFEHLKKRIEESGPSVAAPEKPRRVAADTRLPTARQLDLGNGVKMKLVLIPPGKFTMGSPAGESRRYSDEGPHHRVRVTRPFYMGVYPVTQEEYQQVTGRNPSHFDGRWLGFGSTKRPQNPVETVSWLDATAFCRKLSQKSGVEVRLPTEAEWEYACRAGTTTAYCFGGSDNQLGDYAWYGSPFVGKTHPVGQKKPNAFGLYDMHGNVWEWCQDWYDSGYYAKSPKDDPTGPQTGSRRVLRGGSWYSDPGVCRSAVRDFSTPTRTYYYFGFRVVSRDFR